MNNRTLIGLMSGSSLDGLDVVCVNFWEQDGALHWEVKGRPVTVPYPTVTQSFLKNVHNLSKAELDDLDEELGNFYGTVVKEYIQVNGVSPRAIASHGHTVDHNPDAGYSLQIGSGKHLANASGLPSITNFRTEDILQGGQGAPLAPVVERYLFKGYRMFLNLGGIANISVHNKETVVAYDICPANQLLNYAANLMGEAYDDRGLIAREASADKALIDGFWRDPFLGLDAPKSLDNNYIREYYLDLIGKATVDPSTVLASCCSFIAEAIGKEIRNLSKQHDISDVLITGGGAYNDYLLDLLRLELENVRVNLPSNEIIEQKESLLMALCGYLHLEKIPNSFASATGAKMDTINGVMHLPE